MSKIPSGIISKEGKEIIFRGIKQQKVFQKYNKPDTDTEQNKIMKQFDDGSILVHHFFKYKYNEHTWLGYSDIIGPKGGSQVIHSDARRDDKGELQLYRREK